MRGKSPKKSMSKFKGRYAVIKSLVYLYVGDDINEAVRVFKDLVLAESEFNKVEILVNEPKHELIPERDVLSLTRAKGERRLLAACYGVSWNELKMLWPECQMFAS